jgi:phosphomannomutase
MKRLIVFDLDGTLAASKTPLEPDMATLLGALLGIVKVAVISGGGWLQFEKQLLTGLDRDARLRNLALLPTCGAQFYRYDGAWQQLYSEDFTPDERQKIMRAVTKTLASGAFATKQVWGSQIEDRGTQITFSALGQEAPLEEKKKWDEDFAKRKRITNLLAPLIPEFSVKMGGLTSIDITRQGVDKGYGIRKLRDTLGVAIEDMIFIGDALFPGGNDYPAQEAGVVSIRVRDPLESQRVIAAIIACLDGFQQATAGPGSGR